MIVVVPINCWALGKAWGRANKIKISRPRGSPISWLEVGVNLSCSFPGVRIRTLELPKAIYNWGNQHTCTMVTPNSASPPSPAAPKGQQAHREQPENRMIKRHCRSPLTGLGMCPTQGTLGHHSQSQPPAHTPLCHLRPSHGPSFLTWCPTFYFLLFWFFIMNFFKSTVQKII